MKILFSIQQLCVPPGWQFEEHHHPGIEITGVLANHITLGTPDTLWQAETGQVFVLPPYLPHSWSTDEGADLAVIHLDDVPKDLANSLITGCQPHILTLSHSTFNEYFSLFTRIIALSNSITPAQLRLLRAYLEVFLLVLLENNYEKNFNLVAMQEAASYMRTHLGEPFSIADVAGLFFMSEVTFRRHFQKAFEMTPEQYLLELRLVKAQDLLTTSHLSIQEIAKSVGFFDLAHFSSTFRRRFGLAPTTWRERTYI